MANLEWLSHFVEDSFSEHSPAFPSAVSATKTKEKRSEPEPTIKPVCFRSPLVPAKARSKRSRSGGRSWSLGSPPYLTDSSSGSTSPGSTSSLSSPPVLIFGAGSPAKKQRKKTTDGNQGGSATATSGTKFERRCTHCAVHKTPQWRTGPYGPKTLCNACGVRYKSGRLLPEYRPACSPTFSSERHSNHHRKVLEMRRQKELVGQAEPGLTGQVVPSF